jgi:hypothetical protein
MTRGSQESVIIQLVFNLIFKFDRKISADFFFSLLIVIPAILHGGWRVGVSHIFLEVDQPKIISAQISEQKILM